MNHQDRIAERNWKTAVALVALIAALWAIAGLMSRGWSQEIEVIAKVPAVDPRLLQPIIEVGRHRREIVENPALHPLMQAIDLESSQHRYLQSELLRQLRIELPGDGAGVTFGASQLPMNLSLPAAPWIVRYEFRMPNKGVGTVSYTATIVKDDRPVQRFTGSLSIDRRARGIQVRRLIRRGERIGEADLIGLEADLSQLPNDAVCETDSLIGTVARSEIRPGSWLTGRMVDLPKLIKNRQAVVLMLQNGPIHIVSKGVAKESGAKGEIIRVENIGSKREILARVVDGDTVEVLY